MNLYFYFLRETHNGKSYIQIEECEVVEKAKTYLPVNEFPGYYGGYLPKSEIGIVSGSCIKHVILTEKNDEIAKQVFSDYLNQQIDEKQKEIKNLKEKMTAVKNIGNN